MSDPSQPTEPDGIPSYESIRTEPEAETVPVVAETRTETVTAPETEKRSTGSVRLLSILIMIAGGILIIAGVVTWAIVRDQLAAENITVSEDAPFAAGRSVEGPFTAYAQAEAINDHALAASNGLTYAELDQDDPVRGTVMTASFLRASLFTSVVAFGVAAFAFGIGIVLILIGWALLRVDRSLRVQLA
jgi:hypothetical protein